LQLRPSQVELWRQRVENTIDKFGNSKAKKIGLVWRGNPNHTNDHNRSLGLIELAAHLPQGFVYFVLQKEINSQDLALLEQYPHIINLSSELVDLTDTASLCKQLDLIVCVDTSVAHLGATLNVPTLLLLPFSPDWRWLMQRNDSPWYSCIKVFRQTTPGNWSDALEAINGELLSTLN
jgi:hypothetical protein